MVNMKDGHIKSVRHNIDFMRIGLSNIDTTIVDPKNMKTSYGFGGTNKKWAMYKFSTLLNMLNHTNVRI